MCSCVCDDLLVRQDGGEVFDDAAGGVGNSVPSEHGGASLIVSMDASVRE